MTCSRVEPDQAPRHLEVPLPDVRPTQAATLRDVARAAGVHPGTASRALNEQRRHLVRLATVQRVVAAARALDFTPNQAARALKTKRSYTVGVIIPDLKNPLFPPIVRGIEDRLAKAGFVALLGNTDNDDQQERQVFDRMLARDVDGFILATARRHNAVLRQASSEQLAVVLINRVAEELALPSVSVDDELGIYLAVSHLAALGHRRIAHLAGPQDLSTGRRRHLGFLRAMEACGLHADPSLVVSSRSYSQREGWRCCLELIERGGDWTAIVTGNDLLALGCYRALEERRLSCPDDVSVVGYNDIPFLERLRPPMTAVRIPQRQIGTEAARLLLERIADRQAEPATLILPPALVVRKSTAIPRMAVLH